LAAGGKAVRTSITEIRNCLPEGARKHFIDLRNIRLKAERSRFQARLNGLRAELAAKGQGRSGWQELEEWSYKEDLSNSLATGYVQDAFETCRLYDIPIAPPLSDCLVKAVEGLLLAQYQSALLAQGQGIGDVKIPLVVRLQDGARPRFKIRVMIETARVEDIKKRAAMAKEKEKPANTYHQNITQHGGVPNASQTGNVYAQQITVQELADLRTALAEVRTLLKAESQSLETDEQVGLLAMAEKAAADQDESKMLGFLKQIPSKAWDVGKVLVPQVLLHYLRLHNLA
jgi:hypothetical protein